MALHVLDVKAESDWLRIVEKLCQNLDMPVSLTDADGKILMSAGERNPLCAHIREKTETLQAVCSQTAAAMTAALKASKAPVIDLCEAGLARVAVPIFHENEIVGQVSVCGKATDFDEIDPYYLAMTLDISEVEVGALVKKVQAISDEEMQSFSNVVMKAVNTDV